MTLLTNSEGKAINYTNELIETILSQLNSIVITQLERMMCYLPRLVLIVLILDHTYHINRNTFHNYTMNEDLVNNCD